MNSVLHLIGLARKAGRLAVGEDPVGEAVKSREGKLLLVDRPGPGTPLRMELKREGPKA